MKETTRNLLLGTVSIIALLGFAWLLMRFGELDLFAPARYEVTIHMNAAAGLRPQSQVELNGVSVGAVDGITLQKDRRLPVRVVALIDEHIEIPENVDIKVQRPLIGGSATLELISPLYDPDDPPAMLARDGTAELDGIQRTLMEQITAELDQRTKPIIRALDKFERLSETYIALGENLNTLVVPPGETGEPVSDANVHLAIAKLNAVLDDAGEALRLATKWLDDEQLRADMHAAVTNAGRLIEKATDTLDQFTSLSTKIEGHVDELAKGLIPAADELSLTLAEVRGVLHLAREGEGTVAQMMNNPDLYNSLNDAAMRLERVLIEVQLLIQRIRAEGLPIRF